MVQVAPATDEPIVSNETLPPEGELAQIGPLSTVDGTSDETPSDSLVEERSAGSAQATLPGLAALVLEGRIGPRPIHIIILAFAGWIVVGGWLYVTDNTLGRLDNIDGISWYFFKFGLISLVFTSAIFVILLYWGVTDFARWARKR